MFLNMYYVWADTPVLIDNILWVLTYACLVMQTIIFINYFLLSNVCVYYDYPWGDDDDDDDETEDEYDDYDEDDAEDDDAEDDDAISSKVKQPPNLPVKINYEDKYLERFKKLENKYLNLENLLSLKNSFVFETTPIGRVIMSYNHDNDPDLCHFYYYSNMIIPYKMLDIVAQKYVITFDCKILYLDISAELDNLKKNVIENHKKINDELNRIKEKSDESAQHNNNKLFATFKKYNTTSSSIQIKEDNSKLVIKEKINKYINKGKITNFEFIKKVDKKLVCKNYSLKFSDFKKLNL
jgi:hypothetical protein